MPCQTRYAPILEQRQRVMQPSELVRLHLGRQRAPVTRTHMHMHMHIHITYIYIYRPWRPAWRHACVSYGDMPDAQRPHAVP